MAKSTLTTINQIMSIASKAHYLNGGNASKILAKDKKGIFTIEQVATTLNVDPDELKTLLQQQSIMCGDYVIREEFGDGTKLSTFALRLLNENANAQDETSTDWTSIFTWIIILFVMCTLFNGGVGAMITFILWVINKCTHCITGAIKAIIESK